MFCGLFRGGWDYFSAALVEYHRSKVGMLKKLADRRNVELTSCRRISRNSELPVVRKLLVRVDLLEAHVGAFWHIHAATSAIFDPGGVRFLLDDGGELVDVVALPKLCADVDHAAVVEAVVVAGVHCEVIRRRGEIREQE